MGKSLEEKKEAVRKTRSKNYRESCRLEGMRLSNGKCLVGGKFTLGETYYLSWNGRKPMTCRFIQVTQFGYNFLNEDTNQCVLKRHLYVPTKMRDQYQGDEKFLFRLSDLKVLSLKQAKELTILHYTK